MRGVWIAMMLGVLVSSCAPGSRDLRAKADRLAGGAGMQPVEVAAGDFTLLAYERVSDAKGMVRIYIEGDGNAWLTRNQVSPDPTPIDPTALTLAVTDNAPNVVYLARPCQFIKSPVCGPKYWTHAQFNDQVIASINQAVDHWKGHQVELVGYSGGGAVVLLVAARRNDVVALRTVAGNVDTVAFTDLHHVSPFTDSLNPADYTARLAGIPQRHFVGTNDKVVPEAIIQSYQAKLPATQCSAYELVEGATHQSGWAEPWPMLLAKPLPCSHH